MDSADRSPYGTHKGNPLYSEKLWFWSTWYDFPQNRFCCVPVWSPNTAMCFSFFSSVFSFLNHHEWIVFRLHDIQKGPPGDLEKQLLCHFSGFMARYKHCTHTCPSRFPSAESVMSSSVMPPSPGGDSREVGVLFNSMFPPDDYSWCLFIIISAS